LPQFPAESLNRITGAADPRKYGVHLPMGRSEKGWRTARQDLNIDAVGDFQDWGAA
jgi:hypothetical protein